MTDRCVDCGAPTQAQVCDGCRPLYDAAQEWLDARAVFERLPEPPDEDGMDPA